MNFNLNNFTGDNRPDGKELPERKKRLFNKARGLLLTPEEKQEGMLSFQHFIESKHAELPIKTPYFTEMKALVASASMNLKKRVLVPIAAILIFTLAGTTSFAAAESLPGDPLYQVKIHVNENVEAFFAVGEEANARVAVAHASVRLEEAERLAVQGRLDESSHEYLTERFMDNAKIVESAVTTLQASGNADAAESVGSDFETSLNAHSSVLAQLAGKEDKSEKVKQSLTKMRQAIGGHLAATTILRANAEAIAMASSSASITRSSAKEELASSRRQLMDAEKYISGAAMNNGTEATAVAEARLDVARSVLQASEAKFEIGAYAEAMTLLKSARRVADEARKTAKSVSSSNIGAKWNVRATSSMNVGNASGSSSSDTSVGGAVNVDDPGSTPKPKSLINFLKDKKSEGSTSSITTQVQPVTPVAAPVSNSGSAAVTAQSGTSVLPPPVTVTVPAVPAISVPVTGAGSVTSKIGL